MDAGIKEVFDWLGTLLGAGGLTAITVAYFGMRSSKKEKAKEEHEKATAHIRPSVGAEGVAQIGALMLDGQVGKELTKSVENLTLAYTQCTLVRQEEMRQAKEIAHEQGQDFRRLIEILGVLERTISRTKCA